MDKTTASQKFQQSVRLFSQKRYVEALILLDELNAAFPKQKQVLYGRAQCLAELQRHAEAIAVCDQAIEWFDDANAKKLKARIQRDNFHTIEGPTDLATLLGASAPHAGGGTGLPNLSGLLDLPPMPEPAAAGYRPARSSRRRFYTLLACAAGLLLVFLSDWLCKPYGLLRAPAVRGEILLGAIAAFFMLRSKRISAFA